MKLGRTLSFMALLGLSAWADDWTHLGRDDGRTRLPAESLAAPALLASVATGSSAIASPVAADGFLVLADLTGTLRAYRESDFALLWTASTGSPVIATPLADHGRVYVSCIDGSVRILRLADGVALGSVETGGTGHSSLFLSGGRLFVATALPTPSLRAIDPGSGSVVWSAPLDQVTYSSPAVGGGKVLIPTNRGTLAAFDSITGSPLWTADVGGAPGGSTPLLLGSSAFVMIDGILIRLDLETGSVGATLTLTDTPPADAVSAEWTCSSLALAGGMLTGVVRVDYALDHNSDGLVDSWTLREFAFSADPSAMTLAWQAPLGSAADVGLDSIPPYRIIPSPVSLGSMTVFASSLDSTLRLLGSGGTPTASFALDALCQASPIFANARLYALTTAGTLYAFEDPSAPQPLSASGLSPSAAHLTAPPGTLSWSAGAAGSTYTVRLAQDGEILMDWDLGQVVGSATVPCPKLAPGNLYTWGVRVRNAAGAFAPWAMASFAVGSPPQGPLALTGVPRHARVILSWSASPSTEVTGYQVAYGVTGGPLGPPADVGNILTVSIGNLAIGTDYTFSVTAVNTLGFVSAPTTTTATPVSTISMGGTLYPSLSAALAAAVSGDTVRLSSDVYTVGATLLIPAGVTVRGASALDTRIVATSAVTVLVAATGSSIRDLQLTGGTIGVSAAGSGVLVTHCVITGTSDAGIDVPGDADVINNTIVGNSGAGVRASGQVRARNNILQGNGTGLVGSVSSRYNDVSDGYGACSAGIGDRNSPVVFLAPASGDFREEAGQPSLDAGDPADDYTSEPEPNGSRINLGAFGNTPLAAASPPPAPSAPAPSGKCGLLGLEGVVLLGLGFLRRR